MKPSILFKKSIITASLVTVTIKSDICDVFIKKSKKNTVNIEVLYKPVQGIIDFFSEQEQIGLFNFDNISQILDFELNKNDLNTLFVGNNIPTVKIIIEIPENSKLYVETINSDIKMENISVEFQMFTTNGDISILKSGHGSIASANGFVNLISIFDNFDVHTEVGNIHIKNGHGGVLNISSKNGDIYIKNVEYQKIACKSSKGNLFAEMNDIHYDFMELFSDLGEIKLVLNNNSFNSILLNSINGDTKISLPPKLIVNLDLKTEKGEIVAEKDSEDADEVIIDTDRFYINFGENTPNIQVGSENGNIYIKELDPAITQIIDVEHKIIDDDWQETYQEIEIDTEPELINVYSVNNYGEYIKEFYNKIKKILELKRFFPKKKEKNNEAVMKILEMVENKTISVEEAEKLLSKIVNK